MLKKSAFATFDNQGRLKGLNDRFARLFCGPVERLDQSVLDSADFSKLLATIAATTNEVISPADLLLVRDLNIVFRNIRVGEAADTPRFSGQIVRASSHKILCYLFQTDQENVASSALTADEQLLLEAGAYAFGALHAVKTPILAIRTLAALLGRMANDPEAVVKKSQAIGTECDSLLRMVTETFAISSGRPEFKPLDIRQILEEIVQSRKQHIENQFNLCLTGEPAKILGVEGGLRNAFASLVDNAVHAVQTARPASGQVTISIHDVALEGWVKIVIQDNGCGIPEENKSRIFDVFFTTKKSGSGMGLPTAKKVIEDIHNGQLSFTSQPGEGTTFTVLLPRQSSVRFPSSPSIDLPRKIDDVKKQVKPEHRLYVGQCFEFMTLEHLRESTVTELVAQVDGQVGRLLEYLATGRHHLSINNFSRRTELVIAGDAASVGRAHWENVIKYVLHQLGLEHVKTIPTRVIKLDGSACRIFELSRDDEKLPETEIAELEPLLRARLIPFPTAKELEAQANFIELVYTSLLKQPGFILSVIFNPQTLANAAAYRAVSFKLRFHPPAPTHESFLLDKYGVEQPQPAMFLRHYIDQYLWPGEVMLVHEKIEPARLLALGMDDFTAKILFASGYKSARVAIFPSRKGGRVINAFCSSNQEIGESDTELFLSLNREWNFNANS
ncbi:MAG: HAMP domain-containing histidine kinase [Candidatus Margulisbacteria bacterium]|nr:HAMP domain-containing histidine kinase [Candidatus Margulisiibacteriota bacterium]MBU1867261.1 HAMP domain-containing histidine kinase [Candidatus Margulisiibacteriota bacterium]